MEDILVEKEALQDEDVRKAFEKALQDICDGLLPLGGGTNRGMVYSSEHLTYKSKHGTSDKKCKI